MEQHSSWVLDTNLPSISVPENTKKLPNVSTWAHFNKLPDDEKAKVFNSMRGALIATGLMENGK